MDVYVVLLGAVLLPDLALSFKGGCLTGRGQKSFPSQETAMKECHLYSDASCCFANFTEELVSPVTKVENTKWDVCQQLSDRCETYMKRVECFYQCSPQAAHWMNPSYTAGFLNVPICVNFCDSWYDACKDDLTCAKNWLTDFKWDNDGNHCQHDCVPYSKMYTDGTDMCQSMWGPSFSPSSSEGRCLRMDDQDDTVLSHILCPSSSSKSAASVQEEPCHQSSLILDEISPDQEIWDSLLVSSLFAIVSKLAKWTEYVAYLAG
ncbi:riboflavin-binding protein-like [Anguilla anguilla]|uniref:riboflavin-binding protein-like n=1 Tax=Anguilla anguilla TaxID=7936 RepID=UPI0015B0EFBA|nr:riboflavin-binding protein-like [Anguilla anguilla]